LVVFWTLLNLRDAAHQVPIGNWLSLGAWIGIAGLSIYTAITLVISLVWIMIAEKRYYWLKDKGLWLAILFAALLISPVILWNASNDWISILYQLNHGTHNDDWQWSRVINTQLAQLGVYSIALYAIGLWIMLTSWRASQPTANSLLLAFSLPVIILFALNSGYEMSLPHWTQLAWLLIAPAVAIWLWQGWHKAAVRWLVYISSAITLTLSLLLNSQLTTPWMPLPDNENIVQELHGWPEAVKEAKQYQASLNQAPLFVKSLFH